MANVYIDNVIAIRVLYMLVTPFEETDAFKYGIIDKNGKPLKKSRDLKSDEERASYTALSRLVFSLKRLLAKVPGGDSKIASLAAAYYLVKESYESKTKLSEARVMEVMNSGISLIEEEILVERFLNEELGGIANVTGIAVSTDQPTIHDTNKPQLFTRLKRKSKVKANENV